MDELRRLLKTQEEDTTTPSRPSYFGLPEADRGCYEHPGMPLPCPHCPPVERDLMRSDQEVAAMGKQACENRDSVNRPSHYTAGKIECIDALEAATFDLTGLEAVCTANAIKYLWRWKRKGGHEDLRKARWYINKLLGDTP